MRAGGGEAAAPGPGLYYGWVLVLALGFTATVSYGILSYAFPVFLGPMEAELGWSRTQLTGAFSVAALVAGAAAIPAGRWVDRHGARWLMAAGSVLAALLLVAWSRVESLGGFYLVWTGLGLASAAVLYEPAFAVVANWFARHRGRALTVLTFMGGFASVIFVPLATGLVSAHGWRAALVWLAAILAVLTIPPHALLLRRRPEDHGLQVDGGPPRIRAADARASMAGAPAGMPPHTRRPDRASGTNDPRLRRPGRPHLAGGHAGADGGPPASVPAKEAVRSGSFRWLAIAFGLSSLTTTALAVHLIPLLVERGHAAAYAGGVMGLVGLMALPGRLVFTPLGSRWPRPAVTASIFGLQAVAVVPLLMSSGPLAIGVFVVLFGAGFGTITPARAALVAELYGPAAYGSISGVLALGLSVARAAAPVGASLLHAAGGGYSPVLLAALVLCGASAVAVIQAGRLPHTPSPAISPRDLAAPPQPPLAAQAAQVR